MDIQLQAALFTPEQPPLVTVDASNALHLEISSAYQAMIDVVVERVRELRFEENVPPSQLVMVVPYLGDALRLALASRLEKLNISHNEHRPSRSLAEEPLIQAILTLMRLWSGENATNRDIAIMFSLLLPQTDRIRAVLLSKAAYVKGDWIPFESLSESVRKRISPQIGAAYETLRLWLIQQVAETRMPHKFLAAFIQEFGTNFVAVDQMEYLWQRIEAFISSSPESTGWPALARECIKLITDGFIASHSVYDGLSSEAVLIVPAHTFLSLDRSVDYQFWIDVSSTGWSERMNQVITNPYILRRSFPPDAVWTEELEEASERELVKSLSLGLLRRCRKRVYAFASTTGLTGAEQRGPLLTALQQLLAPAYE
jgi:hypothetical protein